MKKQILWLCLMGQAFSTFAQPIEALNEPKDPPVLTLPAPANSPEKPPKAAVASPLELAPLKKESSAGLRLNFRGVPLEVVLNYLSDAAGFTIVVDPKVTLSGKIDVWSNQPLNKEEALALLGSVLKQNGYALLRDGRMLTVIDQKEAKTRDIPVAKGNIPKDIPKTDQIVTQIIPVRHANVAQLIRDLQPLLADYAQMTANENGNALVLTATQMDVRRIAEIIDAIDTSIASTSAVRIFPLRFADAKSLADLVKELFTVNSNQRGNSGNAGGQNFPIFGGGPGSSGPQGGQGGTRNSADSSSTPGAKVVAVADEHSNSLIVSAVDDLIPTIQRLVRSLDVTIQDISEVRIFRLQNADPNEMADVLSSLFPDESPSNQNQQSGFLFGGPGGPPGGQISAQPNSSSERQKKQGRVITVADPRTRSIIVNAGKDLMAQIAGMIAKLDSDGSRKQKVFVYSLENADVQNVEDILRSLFESNNAQQSSRNSGQNNDALANRANQTQQTSGSTGFGNSGFGGQGQSSGGAR